MLFVAAGCVVVVGLRWTVICVSLLVAVVGFLLIFLVLRFLWVLACGFVVFWLFWVSLGFCGF